MQVMEITVTMFDCPLMIANTDLNNVHLEGWKSSKDTAKHLKRGWLWDLLIDGAL